MSKRILDAHTEIQVVALMVRGDTQDEIINYLETEKGISISNAALTAVKKRNSEAFTFMRSTLAEVETNKATDLLYKSHQALENKLNSHLNAAEELAKVDAQYEAGEFDDPLHPESAEREYRWRKELVLRNTNMSVSELTTLSKEMFNESQVLAGKPTSITDNAHPEENVKRLLTAMKDGDEVGMLNAIFNPK